MWGCSTSNDDHNQVPKPLAVKCGGHGSHSCNFSFWGLLVNYCWLCVVILLACLMVTTFGHLNYWWTHTPPLYNPGLPCELESTFSWISLQLAEIVECMQHKDLVRETSSEPCLTNSLSLCNHWKRFSPIDSCRYWCNDCYPHSEFK